MFYTKMQLGNGVVITTEITYENVFTICPGCDAEHSVDIVELFREGEGDLLGTSVYCTECAQKHKKEKSGCSIPVTLNGLLWLSVILHNAGCGNIVDDVLTEYGVCSLNDLPPEKYNSFGNALAARVCMDTEE